MASSPAATGSDYMDVISTRPDSDWTPGFLSDAMNSAGFRSVNYESARTQLYRMEKKKQVRKRTYMIPVTKKMRFQRVRVCTAVRSATSGKRSISAAMSSTTGTATPSIFTEVYR